jgi:ATP-dependent Clp protease ATP-binding subunit ClpC
VQTAVKLSKRYILDKFLPDKAIDLVDEACSRKSSKSVSKEKLKQIDKLNKKIENIEKKIEKAVQEQNYFTAADLKEEIGEIKSKIHALQSSSDIPKELRENITEEDIKKVIAEKYGVSSSVLSKSEIEFLKSLKDILNKEIL